MGYVDKDGYDRKREYAARRNAKNAEIESLTEEQHEALAEVCRIRHELHTHQKSIFNCGSSEYCEMWDYMDDDCDMSINATLKNAGLAPISLPIDPIEAPNDSDWFTIMDEDDRAQYADYDEWYAETFDKLCYSLNEVNNAIEAYLRNIDNEHGTNYCPTGATRIY